MKNSFFDYSDFVDYPIFFDECVTHSQNRLFAKTIDKYHEYMNWTDIPSRRINWNIYETKTGNHIGCIGISSAVLALGAREKFIGWDKEEKFTNLNMIANNYRYCLIKDNITIKNTGSMALKLMRVDGARAWERKYGDRLVLIETFVKPPWTGSVYKADNWENLGMTKGNSISKAPVKMWLEEDSPRGELARKDLDAALEKYASYQGGERYKVSKSEPKIILVKPLVRNFRKLLKKI